MAACTLLVMDQLSNDVIVGLSWQRATGITITPGNPNDLLNGQPVVTRKAESASSDEPANARLPGRVQPDEVERPASGPDTADSSAGACRCG